MRRKDKFIQRYIPHDHRWKEVLQSGLSPNSNGECEAIRRQLIRLGLKDLQSMETWFWSGEKVEEALALPLPSHGSGDISLYDDVGLGLHLFKNTNAQGERIPSLWQKIDDGDGNMIPNMPMGIIIEKDSVKEVALINEDPDLDTSSLSDEDFERLTLAILLIPADRPFHPHFLTAAKMTCFLHQKVVDAKKVKAAPRAERRRWGMDAPESQSEINVVTWRTAKQRAQFPGYNSRSERTRNKHWPVKGHLRLQPYPSEGAFRVIYIGPHFRGNLNAPLHRKTKINKVVK